MRQDLRRPATTLLKASPLSPIQMLPYPLEDLAHKSPHKPYANYRQAYPPYPLPWMLQRNPKENHICSKQLEWNLKGIYTTLAMVSEELNQLEHQHRHTEETVLPVIDSCMAYREQHLATNAAVATKTELQHTDGKTYHSGGTVGCNQQGFPDTLQRNLKSLRNSQRAALSEYQEHEGILMRQQKNLEQAAAVLTREISDKQTALESAPAKEFREQQIPLSPKAMRYSNKTDWAYWEGPGDPADVRKMRSTTVPNGLARNREDGFPLRAHSPWSAVFPTTTPRRRPAQRRRNARYKGVNGATLVYTESHPDEATHRHDSAPTALFDGCAWTRSSQTARENSEAMRRTHYLEEKTLRDNIVHELQEHLHHFEIKRRHFKQGLESELAGLRRVESTLKKLEADTPIKCRKMERMEVFHQKQEANMQQIELNRRKQAVSDMEQKMKGAARVMQVEVEAFGMMQSVTLRPTGSINRLPKLGYDHLIHGYMPPELHSNELGAVDTEEPPAEAQFNPSLDAE